ncbi:hypothetical protein GCM10011578_043660 [Streptomyces fuscichromogenes]|uniref:Uncharacterized protein n=1 Tax=Streptomyces fuscichromogenes TaxID=1324013 RepID=A0A917XE56_9ACTN|nr:hypothetical protein GCM10011578_043660 [Streptomyces fuscichromogenes]
MTPGVRVPSAAVFAETFFGVSAPPEPQAATEESRRNVDKEAAMERTRIIGMSLPFRLREPAVHRAVPPAGM